MKTSEIFLEFCRKVDALCEPKDPELKKRLKRPTLEGEEFLDPEKNVEFMGLNISPIYRDLLAFEAIKESEGQQEEPQFWYESHLGGLFSSDEELSLEDLYCEECGDYDDFICYGTKEEALRKLNGED